MSGKGRDIYVNTAHLETEVIIDKRNCPTLHGETVLSKLPIDDL